jgi:Tfp pilus assembly protein PilN
LPEGGRERAEALSTALTEFLRDIEVTPDQVVLCLSRRVACVSRLIVPETARGSLPQILDYEVERLLPFPKEEIYYDHLTYRAGGAEGRIGVTVICLPRRVVDEHLELLAQLRPQMVTVSSSALASTLAFCTPPTVTPCVVIAPENGEMELSFIEKNQLIASHLFSLAHVQGREEFTDLLAQGAARNLPGVALQEMSVFASEVNGKLPLGKETAHDLTSLIASRLPLPEGVSLSAAALPALGAALQAVGEATVEVNLLPVDKRAQREKRLSPLTLILGALVVLLGAVWAVGVVVQEHRILNSLTQQSKALEPAVQQVLAQEEESQRLLGRLQTVREATDKRVVPLLKDLTELIPVDVYLTNFRYKDGSVELSGVAAKSASDLVAVLEGSTCLRNVAPKAPFTKTANGETFTLGAQVESCS